MDYPFFIKPIAEIPFGLIQDVLNIVLNQSFTPHPHFSNVQKVTTVIGRSDFGDELGQATKKLLNYIPIEKTTVGMWEINRLCAGDSILEHSDISSQNGIQGSKVVKTHKIHIPLKTHHLVRFGHRRSKNLPIEYQLMTAGYAYAYNNYVWHSVENHSPIDRYQMTIRYIDPDWITKCKLLECLKIDAKGYYE